MESFFQNFQTLLNDNQIQIENKCIDKVFKRFSFYHFSKNNHLSLKSKIDDITKIELKCDHQIIFISDYLENDSKYFIICI